MIKIGKMFHEPYSSLIIVATLKGFQSDTEMKNPILPVHLAYYITSK